MVEDMGGRETTRKRSRRSPRPQEERQEERARATPHFAEGWTRGSGSQKERGRLAKKDSKNSAFLFFRPCAFCSGNVKQKDLNFYSLFGLGPKRESQRMSSKPMQGWLIKQGGSIKTWKKRHCVIKDGALHYSKSAGDKPLGQMEVKGSLIQNHADAKKKYCFEIGTEKRVYLLVADSDKERTEWVNALKAEQDRVEGRGGAAENVSSSTPEPTKKEEVAETPASKSNEDVPEVCFWLCYFIVMLLFFVLNEVFFLKEKREGDSRRFREVEGHWTRKLWAGVVGEEEGRRHGVCDEDLGQKEHHGKKRSRTCQDRKECIAEAGAPFPCKSPLLLPNPRQTLLCDGLRQRR